MDVKRKKFGFTLVEMLTVLGIIALLLGLLLPALGWVRRIARETKQKVQLTTIGLTLEAFKNDYGDYPESKWFEAPFDYCGAQKLAEALLGWDLMGFHPDSAWRADGFDRWGGLLTYDPDKVRDDNGDLVPDTLDERVGPYLELATTNAFRLGDLFGAGNTGDLAEGPYVICDAFGVKPISIGGKTVRAGTPILYYRANTSKKTIEDSVPENNIYNARDNFPLIDLRRLADWKKPVVDREQHKILAFPDFYEYIKDPKVSDASRIDWPYRPDSYILISAGADGLYGTGDDITNFGN